MTFGADCFCVVRTAGHIRDSGEGRLCCLGQSGVSVGRRQPSPLAHEQTRDSGDSAMRKRSVGRGVSTPIEENSVL